MTAEAAHWGTLLAACSGVFTTPSFQIFLRMLSAWALCPGRRTVTRIYQITEPLPGKAHDAYHRFLREADWSMAALWKLVAVRLVSLFYPTGKIPIDTDDRTTPCSIRAAARSTVVPGGAMRCAPQDKKWFMPLASTS